MTTFLDYTIRFVDVSQNQDDPNTTYFPDLTKIKTAGFTGIGIRTSYGQVTDRAFKRFWALAKGKLDRVPYHYLDYYSHKSLGITDEQWGVKQAQYVWSLLKDDPGEFPLYLDVEKSSYGGDINILNKSSVGRIITAFLTTYDKLSNGTAGIYTNQGYLWVFGNIHRTRPLWFSWYNRLVTIEKIRSVMDKNNWTGRLTLFQYTSDGDADNNGTPDGKTLGFESTALDLNVFIGTPDEYSAYSGTTQITIPIESDDNQTDTSLIGKIATVINAVNVRSGAGTSASQWYKGSSPFVLRSGSFTVLDYSLDSNKWQWIKINNIGGDEFWVCVATSSTQLIKIT